MTYLFFGGAALAFATFSFFGFGVGSWGGFSAATFPDFCLDCGCCGSFGGFSCAAFSFAALAVFGFFSLCDLIALRQIVQRKGLPLAAWANPAVPSAAVNASVRVAVRVFMISLQKLSLLLPRQQCLSGWG